AEGDPVRVAPGLKQVEPFVVLLDRQRASPGRLIACERQFGVDDLLSVGGDGAGDEAPVIVDVFRYLAGGGAGLSQGDLHCESLVGQCVRYDDSIRAASCCDRGVAWLP